MLAPVGSLDVVGGLAGSALDLVEVLQGSVLEVVQEGFFAFLVEGHIHGFVEKIKK